MNLVEKDIESQDDVLIVRLCGVQGSMICNYAPHEECWDCQKYWEEQRIKNEFVYEND